MIESQNNETDKKNLRKELRTKMVTYIMAAFGLVAALAWNDAIRTLIEKIWPADRDTLLIKFIYALIITIVVVVVSINLMKFAEKKEEKK